MGRLFAVSDSVGTVSSFIGVKLVTLNHTGALTAYQKTETITHEIAMQSDFSDIRFTTLAGTHIPYWLESKTDSVTADVWIKNDYDSGDTLVWMYYGNDSLSSGSSISDVFVGGDDFTTDGWTDTGSLIYVDTGNEYLYMKGDRSSTDHHSAKAVTPLADFEMEFNISHISSTTNDFNSMFVGIASNDERFLAVDNAIGVFFGYHTSSGGVNIRATKRESDSIVYGTPYYYGYGATLTVDSVVIIRRSGTTVDVEVWNSDKSSLLVSTQWTGTSLGDLDYFLSSNYNDGFNAAYLVEWSADNMRMRKYVTTEPTSTIGPEMHQRRASQYI